MRIKSAIIVLSSLIISLIPAIADAQPVSACRISTSENQIVSIGFPFKPERLSYVNNPKILVLPYQLKGEPKYTLTEIDRGYFNQAADSIAQLSQNKSVIDFVYGETINLEFTALEMDNLRINNPTTFQKDFKNSTFGFVEKVIQEADQKIDYSGIDAVILFGSSVRQYQTLAEAMMFTNAKLAFGYGAKKSGSNSKWWDSTIVGDNWFDPIKSSEGEISNAVLIYNELNHSVLTHEIMHLYGLTDLYGSATSPNHSLMSNGILNLLGFEEWVLGWLPDENVQCINLDSELSKTTLDNKLSIKKSNRNQLIVIPTGPKTAIIVEQVYQNGKNHLLFYSLDNDARPAITTFRDDYTFEFFIDVSGTLGASKILTGKTFNLLVENNDGKDISFRLIPPSLMNANETKKLISAAEVNRQDAELKVKQDAAVKAAAELKIKQEAEAKLAADKVAADLKIKQEAEAKVAAEKAAAAASKKTTITCVKGKLAKKVTAVKPVCPKGYKKK
jgi:M6 family metalloprotease-like protein